mgnify:CR=1 FL=1
MSMALETDTSFSDLGLSLPALARLRLHQTWTAPLPVSSTQAAELWLADLDLPEGWDAIPGARGRTNEACDFRDSLTELNGQGVDVVGISPDKVEALEKFRDKYDISFPLLSDPSKETLTAYGAFGEKKNYGKVVQGVIRSTFVIDEEGTVTHAWYNVRASGHVAKLRRDLGLD